MLPSDVRPGEKITKDRRNGEILACLVMAACFVAIGLRAPLEAWLNAVAPFILFIAVVVVRFRDWWRA